MKKVCLLLCLMIAGLVGSKEIVLAEVEVRDCATVDSQINLSIPCVDVGGTLYNVGLKRTVFSEAPNWYYWKYDGDISGGTYNSQCSSTDNYLNISIPCVDVNGLLLEVELSKYISSSDPFSSVLYWKLEAYQEIGTNPICDSDNLSLCTTSSDCGDANGYWWSNNTCDSTSEPIAETTIKIGTLNMSVGFDVLSLVTFFPQSPSSLNSTVNRLSEDIQASQPEQRIQLIARAIMDYSLDAVVLQEVLKFQSNGYTIDFLNSLLTELNRHDPGWQGISQILNHISIETIGADEIAYQTEFNEGNAIVYRAPLGFINYQEEIFPEEISAGPFPLLGDRYYSERGAQILTLEDGNGEQFNLINTHLEISLWGNFQISQLHYLLDSIDDFIFEPRLLLGDLNLDDPESLADINGYGFLDSREEIDELKQLNTCCFPVGPATVSLAEDEASERIDYIFADSCLALIETGMTLNQAANQDDSTLLWASDHALVMATYSLASPPQT